MSTATCLQSPTTSPPDYIESGRTPLGQLGNDWYEARPGKPKATRSSLILQWINKILHQIKDFGMSPKARARRWDRDACREVNNSLSALLNAALPVQDPRDLALAAKNQALAAMNLNRLLDCRCKLPGGAFVESYGRAIEQQLKNLHPYDLKDLNELGMFSPPDFGIDLLGLIEYPKQEAARKIVNCVTEKLRQETDRRRTEGQKIFGGRILIGLETVPPLRQGEQLGCLTHLVDVVDEPAGYGLIWQTDKNYAQFLVPALSRLSDERLARFAENLRSHRDALIHDGHFEDKYIKLVNEVIGAFDDAKHARLGALAKAGAKSLRNSDGDIHGLTRGKKLETGSSRIYRDISDAVKRLTGQDPVLDGRAAKERDEYFEYALQDLEPDDIQRCLSALDASALVSLKSSVAGNGTRIPNQIDRLHEQRSAIYQQDINKMYALLGEAAMRGDRDGATTRLAELAGIVVPFGEYLSHFGQPMPQATLRRVVNQALRLFHDPARAADGAAASLTLADLQRLSSAEIKNLRVAHAGLKDFGLRIDDEAVETVVADRLKPYEDAAVEAATAFVWGLRAPETTAYDTVSSVRDMVDSMMACLHAQRSLGDPADERDRTVLAEKMVTRALWQASLRSDVNLAGNFFSRHCRPLVRELDTAQKAAAKALANAKPDAVFALTHTSDMLSAAKELLEVFLADLGLRREIEFKPTQDIRLALKGEFGVHYDMNAQVTFDRTKIQQQQLKAAILESTSIDAHAMVEIAFPFTNATETISVSEQFSKDAIDRPGLVLSAGGISSKGARIRPAIPDQRYIELNRDARLPAMEQALRALTELDPDACKTLTPIMNQQLIAGYMTALQKLDEDSPVTLPDGRPVLVMNASEHLKSSGMFFDVERQPDGNYKLAFAHVYPQVDKGLCVRSSEALAFDPDKSHMSVRGAVMVDPAGTLVEMLGPVDFRYRLTPA